MKPVAYYNEFDAHAAQWLRNLMDMGVIPFGVVDERDLRLVKPEDLSGFTQCHFFAGIGVWPFALRLAGWPDHRRVWTGSCPCQGFSGAGLQKGFDDERHLWPDWYKLIDHWRPEELFGEQVSSNLVIGKARDKESEHGPYGFYAPDRDEDFPPTWIDLVQSDMENSLYALGIQVTPAASVGAPHRRERTYFAAHYLGSEFLAESEVNQGRAGFRDSGSAGERGHFHSDSRAARIMANGSGERSFSSALSGVHRREESPGPRHGEFKRCGESRRLDDRERLGRRTWRNHNGRDERQQFAANGLPVWLDDRERARLERYLGDGNGISGRSQTSGPASEAGEPGTRGGRSHPLDGFWRDSDWLFCRDGKWRPIKPGTEPLVDGLAFRLDSGSAFAGKSRAEILKGAGNAIVAEQAKVFIESYLEATGNVIDGSVPEDSPRLIRRRLY